MDKTLIDYDKNLEELERQREKLEIVMQMMGQEWEESGAGIGWLGQLDLPETSAQDPALPIPVITSTATTTTTISTLDTTTTITSDKLDSITTVAESGTVAMETASGTIAMETASNETLSIVSHPPLFSNILTQATGPSPEYLQSLLNVNEALLAQSLANNGDDHTSMTNAYQPSTPMLTPIEEHREMLLDTKLNSPMTTPQQDDDDDTPLEEDVNNTPRDYLGAVNPDSEMILSPLATNSKPLQVPATPSSTKKSIFYQ
ncbi:hypothetical protein MAM1_0372c10131 [Mucor ambiguus]|uniref:Uncharacterized protein n=1 Tax=Mucor ambiguus TaxID=91626 RepID=A0A0C9N3G4_9FUNG|nr:hypothetical protein MAM1_0372c10131 [Mucor ambiguus]